MCITEIRGNEDKEVIKEFNSKNDASNIILDLISNAINFSQNFPKKIGEGHIRFTNGGNEYIDIICKGV